MSETEAVAGRAAAEPVRVACLSTQVDREQVLAMLAPRDAVEVVCVPPSPQPAHVLVDAVAEADLVIAGGNHHVTRAVLTAMRRCRLVQFPGAGVDTIDVEAAADLGIPVANAAGLNRDAVADWTLMAILNLVRRGSQLDRRMREGAWAKASPAPPELGALTAGIIGLGSIGSAVARRLMAFGARVTYHDLVERDLPGATPVTLEELLRSSDVVCVHTPLDQGTRSLIDDQALAAMRPGVILVNAARGGIVDEVAALAALRSGHLGGLGVDVFEREPLPASSPLRREENVFLTPHVAGTTSTSIRRIMDFVGANLRRALDGQEPLNVVNGVPARRS